MHRQKLVTLLMIALGALSACSSGSDSISPPVVASEPKQIEPAREVQALKRESMDKLEEGHSLLSSRAAAPAQEAMLFSPAMTLSDSIAEVVDRRISYPEQNEQYQKIENNPVVRVADQATSTFSIDVDTGAYANVRRFLNSGQMPPTDAVRIEELINYFSYDYPAPSNQNQPFSITTEVAAAPWNPKTQLLHIGLKGYTVQNDERPPANLVFLMDVSGSMAAENKLGLLKSSIMLLVDELTEKDHVSIVVYAGASGVVLEPTPGNDLNSIENALKSLKAGGSTNGQAGIELAYQMAEKHLSKEGINRVILATDGDFNVGISDTETLISLIEKKRKSGIALSTLGFGTGNYNDHLMEQLADTGNGAYAYIDTLNEARKVLSEELTSSLLTIAKDVKIQVEFNPSVVSEYRLIGYVNRRLENEDFNNDKVDAGEIGAGHSVTAIYEIALHGSGGERHSPSRYSSSGTENQDLANASSSKASSAAQEPTLLNELGEVRIRYKLPKEDSSLLISEQIERNKIKEDLNSTSENFRFSAAVASFGQLLTESKYLEHFSYDDAATLARGSKGEDHFGYRGQFIQLVELAKGLSKHQ